LNEEKQLADKLGAVALKLPPRKKIFYKCLWLYFIHILLDTNLSNQHLRTPRF